MKPHIRTRQKATQRNLQTQNKAVQAVNAMPLIIMDDDGAFKVICISSQAIFHTSAEMSEITGWS